MEQGMVQQLYFSSGLTVPLLPRFTEGFYDCDELSGDGYDDNLVWFPGGSQTVGEGSQDRVVNTGDEGCLKRDMAQ